MATSMAAAYRRLYHAILLSNPKASATQLSRTLFSTKTEAEGELPALPSESDSATDTELDSSTSSASSPSSASDASTAKRKPFSGETVLEDGIDVGIYKAIIVGQIGQTPLQKKNKNGISVVLTTVGTGGVRNQRVPFANEEPREYAERSIVQWHRVAVYHPGLGNVVMSQAKPGTLVYMEGNLETRIFSDPVSGLVRRIREIAVRRNGRIVFLGDGSDYKPSEGELKGVGYY